MVLMGANVSNQERLWLSLFATPGDWIGRKGAGRGGLVIRSSAYGFLRYRCGYKNVEGMRVLDFSSVGPEPIVYDYILDPMDWVSIPCVPLLP